MNLAINAQRDPTRTATLRGQYAAAARGRFVKVKKLVRESVVDNDALALDPGRRLSILARAAHRYDFPSDPAGKAQAFMDWLMQAADDEILEVTQRDGRRISAHSAWQNVYVRAAYSKAIDGADKELFRAGVKVPEGEIWAMFRQPMHANTLALLFTRNFDELRGITEAMGQAIARELAMGLAKGLGAAQIARLLNARVDKIGIHRATLLARTEIIRAYAEASLNRYEEMGIGEVIGEVELATAGDQRVCPICKSLRGRTYTIAEARGIIPVHPQCRCAWKPVILTANTRRYFAVGRGNR